MFNHCDLSRRAVATGDVQEVKYHLIFIGDEIQVKFWLIRTINEVDYKTTDLATKYERKHKSLSVSKGKRPFSWWNRRMPLDDRCIAVSSS